MTFLLWIEYEHWESEESSAMDHDFFNIVVTLADGTRYSLNVWSILHLEAMCNSLMNGESYFVPPDVVVSRTDRLSLEGVVGELVRRGELREHWQVK